MTDKNMVDAVTPPYQWKHPHQSEEFILRDAIYFAERHTGVDFPLMYLQPLAKAAKSATSCKACEGLVKALEDAIDGLDRDLMNGGSISLALKQALSEYHKNMGGK